MKDKKREFPTTVLLVDDEPVILDLLFEYFAMKNIKVKSVPSAKEALEYLEMEALKKVDKVDGVVTDIKMPEMDGIELSKRIHEKYPVIMISAHCSDKYLDNIVDLHDAYLDKLRAKEELVDATMKGIERWNLMRENRKKEQDDEAA